jgi:hypothetical protein
VFNTPSPLYPGRRVGNGLAQRHWSQGLSACERHQCAPLSTPESTLESRHDAAARLNLDVAAGWSDKMGGEGAHVPGGAPLRIGSEGEV